MNDSISVTLKSGIHGECTQLGFDYLYEPMNTYPKEKSSYSVQNCVMSLRQIQDTTTLIVAISDIDKIIDKDGNMVKGEILDSLASMGQIPFLSVVAVQDSTGRKLVSIDQINQIETLNKRHAKWIGLGIGTTIDADVITFAVIVAVAISHLSLF